MLLHSTTRGSGPHLILLHGLFASANNWRGVAQRLENRFAVTAFDLRNHGQSPWSDTMDYGAMAEDVAESLGALGTRPAWVVGHSMGGKVGMELAVRRPGLVAGLVIGDIAARAYRPEHGAILRALNALNLARHTGREEVDAALRADIPEAAVRHFLLTNLKRSEGGAFRWRVNLKAITAAYPRLLEEVAREGLYAGPTLVLSGGRSRHVRDEDEAPMRQKFPHCVFRRIPTAGHWVHADAPEEFVGAILHFIRSTTAG